MFLINAWTVMCVKIHLYSVTEECGNSVVERRTRNRGSPGTNLLSYPFEDWAFSLSPRRPCSLNCLNEYLAIDSGGNVND